MQRREETSTTKTTKWQEYLLMLTLNFNGLNSPIKRHRMARPDHLLPLRNTSH
jgi:hypothetical protein